MILHYLANALVNFRKTPFTTAANVLTLALGLACFIAAFGIATYWKSADNYHEKADRTYIIGQSLLAGPQSGSDTVSTRSSATLARYLRQDFPEIENISRVFWPEVTLAGGPETVSAAAAIVEPDYLRIFDFDFLAGDPRTALDEPGSVVITRDLAERMFGSADVLGRSIRIDNTTNATITGVIGPVRQPSFMGSGPDFHVGFELLGHWNLHPGGAMRDSRDNWSGTQGLTFVALKEGTSVDDFNARLPAFIDRRADLSDEQRAASNLRIQALPVGELTTRGLDGLIFGASGLDITVVFALVSLGALTLIVSIMNYANLAAAQAAARTKEVGLRKVLGAGRRGVFVQSMIESAMLIVLSVMVALAALALISPLIRASFGVDALYFLSHGASAYLTIAALVIATAVVAGLYPALAMSNVRPVGALNAERGTTGRKLITRALVAIQFAAASFLLIFVMVAQLQRGYLDRTALQPHEDPIAMINELGRAGVSYDTLADRLSQEPAIESITTADRGPWERDLTIMTLVRSPDAGASEHQASLRQVGHDYFSTLSFDVLAGRAFDREHETGPQSIIGADPSRPVPVILDQAMAEAMGFSSPATAVGELVYIPIQVMQRVGGSIPQPAQIIGVVETDVMHIGELGLGGHMYFFAPNSPFGNGVHPIIRLSREDPSGGIAAINRVWRDLAPDTPLKLRFYDDVFEEAYKQFARINKLFILLAATAFVIASVGQLGIAVFVAGRRRREVAIRKTLGSSAARVVRLFLTDFSKPVLIGNLLAWPLAYLAAQAYLSAFANHVELTAAPFVFSMAVTLAIAWAAIFGVVMKAARVRPADVLRHA